MGVRFRVRISEWLAELSNEHVQVAVWLAAFGLRFLLSQAVLFPLFYEIHPADELGYLQGARSFMNGLAEGRLSLIPYARSPLVMLLHAVFYAPVHKSLYWISLTSWGSRIFLFTLLWCVAYLISRELRHKLDWRIFLSLVFISPAIPRLLNNSSDALFAGMSGLALWQFLSFYRNHKLAHLAFASGLLGLAALSRNDGLALFGIALILSVVLALRARSSALDRLTQVTSHILVVLLPFAILIGGYMAAYRWATGNCGLETGVRAYFAFEQGEGVAYSVAPEALIDGVFEARRLYGSPEENNYSVFRAISNNPQAFFRRLLHLPRSAGILLLYFYGGSLAVSMGTLSLGGVYAAFKSRKLSELHLVILWPAHLLIYVIFFARGGYLLTPYFAIIALASTGLTALARERSSSKILAVGASVAGLNASIGLFLGDQRMLFNTLPILLAMVLALAWNSILAALRRSVAAPIDLAAPYMLILPLALALGSPYPGLQSPQVGFTPAEKSGVYLAQNFPRHAVIGSHMPAVVFMAKMVWRPMVWDLGSGSGSLEGRFQEFDLRGSEDLRDWMGANQIDAIYMDDLLKHFQPELYALIEEQIGGGLIEVFSVPADDPDRARFYVEERGIDVVKSHRIVVPVLAE